MKETSIEDVMPGLHKSEKNKIQSNALLSQSIEYLSESDCGSQVVGDSWENAECDRESDYQESPNLNLDETLQLEDAMEVLREQVESLKHQLYEKELELQELEQELRYTNEELCAAYSFHRPTLDEAKELAKNILASNKSARESLAELLGAIYGSPVKMDELEQIDKLSSIPPGTSPLYDAMCKQHLTLIKKARETVNECKMLRGQMRQLNTQFKVLKANFKKV